MPLGRVGRDFAARFRSWDRPTQLAFALAVILFFIIMALGAALPPDSRDGALAGLAGVLVAMQLIVLWGNRNLVSSFTRAQRLYLAGEFAAARDLLESAPDLRPGDYKARALLGNIYRQMGDVDKSEEVLSAALQLAPDHHFVLYGFGRTLLSKGQYAEAARAIASALRGGAPDIVRVDLAEAGYRAGAPRDQLLATLDAARAATARAHQGGEAHQALMLALLRWRLGQDEPPDPALIDAGLPYWEAAAARFALTPYGAALAEDIRELRLILSRARED